MVRMSAKVYADRNMDFNKRLVTTSVQRFPLEYTRRFRKNVAPLTPRKRGNLRRSIRTQVIGSRAVIRWVSPYAGPQQAGQHTRNGVTYIYRNYTTPGTGKDFARKAMYKTNGEIGQMVRELGLT